MREKAIITQITIDICFLGHPGSAYDLRDVLRPQVKLIVVQYPVPVMVSIYTTLLSYHHVRFWCYNSGRLLRSGSYFCIYQGSDGESSVFVILF